MDGVSSVSVLVTLKMCTVIELARLTLQEGTKGPGTCSASDQLIIRSLLKKDRIIFCFAGSMR